ncbi:MAG: hypothetical protein ACJ77K_00810 [Bacteroidia bacterium]
MKKTTEVFIFNENGIIKSDGLGNFCSEFQKKSFFRFLKKTKNEISPQSTIFQKFSLPDLDFIVYDYGYVMKIEGEVKIAIEVLHEFDMILDPSANFYISPIQRIDHSESVLFPRGEGIEGIAKLLDQLFDNNDYTSTIVNQE